MKVLSFLCVLLVSVASAKQQLSELQYRNAFTNWMIAHQRSYSSEEFAHRYGVFKSNMDYVNDWNSKGSETVLGLNVFADITNDEFRSTYLGTTYDASAVVGSQKEKIFGATPPASQDWRAKGAVTGIKNQGQCGGCWSFSATGSTEGAHEIKTKNLVSLSEQQLIDCSTANSGCDGGLMSLAFEYIISNGGIDTESSYPFTGQDGTCKFNKKNIGATLSSYQNITSGSEASLTSAAGNVGPVSVAIDASNNSFQLYSSGIYYEPACSTTQLDHGVLVVGYGSGSGSSQGGSSQSEGSQSQSQGSWSQGSSQSESSQSEGSWSQGSWSQGSSQSQSEGSWSQGSSQSEGSWSQGSQSQSEGSWSQASSNSGGSGGSWSWGENVEASNGQYYIVKNSWGTDWGMNGYILMSRNRNNNCGIASMASIPRA